MANSNSGGVATNVVIGRRQILRELKKNNVEQIVIANDAEAQYISGLIEVAKQAGVAYKLHGTMNEISATYHIEVPSGAVGILKS